MYSTKIKQLNGSFRKSLVVENKNYLIVLLLAVSTFNFMDHQILALLMQPIKDDMDLTDAQLGMLSGIAFAVFYCLLGIPMARWADKGNRITIISLSVAMFSGMTALFGTATSYWQLFLCRIGVGVGEAGTTPPSHSLISDRFSRSERPMAMSFFMMGSPIGLTLGYFFAGWLNEFYGWRTAFIVMGLPGLLLAAIVKITLRDPRIFDTDKSVGRVNEAGDSVDLGVSTITQTISFLFRIKTYQYLIAALSIFYFVGYGLGQWIPAYFIRTHGMQTGELGSWLAIISLIGAFVIWLGGYLSTRYLAGDEKKQLFLMGISLATTSFFHFLIFIQDNQALALFFLAVAYFPGFIILGPVYAIVQELSPAGMRAMAVAVVYLVINFVGMGLGPLAIGVLSDLLYASFGDEALRVAIISFLPLSILGGWMLYQASKTVKEDMLNLLLPARA